jgi:hypothetical protein
MEKNYTPAVASLDISVPYFEASDQSTFSREDGAALSSIYT